MRLHVSNRTVSLTVLLYTLMHIVICKPASSATQQLAKAERDIDISSIRIEAFKQSILDQLGYSTLPNVSKVNHSIETKRNKIREFRDYLRSKNDMQHIPDTDEIEADSETIQRIYKGDDTKWNPSHVNSPTFYYQIREQQPNDFHSELFVKSANLYLFKKQTNKSNVHRAMMEIKVFKIEQNERNEFVRGKQIASRKVDVSKSGWEGLDISDTVQEWIDSPESNYGLTFTSSTHNISQFISFREQTLALKDILNFDDGRHSTLPEDYPNTVGPLLTLHAQIRPILKRIKRQAGRRDCTEGDGEDRCCRFKTQITFSEIGWDWVLAPKYYNAYYCEGLCPGKFKMTNTFAGIKSVLHRLNPSKFSGPCCVPSSFKPLSILHKDEHEDFVITDFSDMIVQDCKCA